jgi:nucleoside-diphosphate-sugar epimerase
VNILITGSTSSIGANLVQKLELLNYKVLPLGGRNSKIWTLGSDLPGFGSKDVLIHLAHDRNSPLSKNINDIETICKSFDGKKIFLSSMSAHSKTSSLYGRSKFEAEKIFAAHGGASLRAGVVYGGNSGGIYARLEAILRKSYFVPMPYRGATSLFTSHIDDLVNEIIDLVDLFEFSYQEAIFAANRKAVSLEKIITQISKHAGLNNKFIGLPNQPFEVLRRAASIMIPRNSILDSLNSISIEASKEELSRLFPAKTIFREFNLVNQINKD